MNRTRQILKKSAAAALGASLILSGSSTAFAAAAARCGDLPAGDHEGDHGALRAGRLYYQ